MKKFFKRTAKVYHKTCKVDKCELRYNALGLCKKHASAFYRGNIDAVGNFLNGYTTLVDNCRFPECRKTRKDHLRKGLCNKHRKWAEKGIIDKETCEVLKPERIKKDFTELEINNKQYHLYKEETGEEHLVESDKCKAIGCDKPRRRYGLCAGHSSAHYEGKIDPFGRKLYDRKTYNKCEIESCIKESKRFVRGMCLYHYNKALRKKDFKKIYNIGEATSEQGQRY